MPGAFLKAVGLPYKDYKKGRRAAELREEITGALAAASGIPLPNLDSIRMGCHASDDFLDAVVAAVGAACWVKDKDRFRHPRSDELVMARLEGWIYVPYPESDSSRPRSAAKDGSSGERTPGWSTAAQ